MRGRDGVVDLNGVKWDQRHALDGARFDTAECQGCAHNQSAAVGADKRMAKPFCFDVACWDEKTRKMGRIEGQAERVQAYLDQWLRERIIAHMMAENVAKEQQLESLPPFFELVPTLRRAITVEKTIAGLAVRQMSRANLRRLARYLKVVLQDGYRLDEAYLKLWTKDQLQELAGELGISDSQAWAEASRGKRGAMDACLLEAAADRNLVPQRLAEAFAVDVDAQDPGSEDALDEDLEMAQDARHVIG